MNGPQQNLIQSDNEWLDGQEVMQMLHIKVETLKNWRRSGVIPYSKLGGKLYYNLPEIKQLLLQNKQGKK